MELDHNLLRILWIFTYSLAIAVSVCFYLRLQYVSVKESRIFLLIAITYLLSILTINYIFPIQREIVDYHVTFLEKEEECKDLVFKQRLLCQCTKNPFETSFCLKALKKNAPRHKKVLNLKKYYGEDWPADFSTHLK